MSEPDRSGRWAIALLLSVVVWGLAATTYWPSRLTPASVPVSSPQDPMALGASAFSRGDYADALAAFAIAADRTSDARRQARAHHNRCLTWLALADWAAAIGDCTTALELNPQLSDAYLNRGLAYRGQQNRAAATQDFEAVLHQHPLDGRAWYNHGLVMAEQQQGREAIKDFNRAILQFGHESLDRLAQVYYDRAITWLDQGDRPQALADLDRSLRYGPQQANGFHLRGLVLQALGRSTEAIGSFDRAIALAPMNGLSYMARSQLHQQMHCHQAAIHDLECAVRCFYDCGDWGAFQTALTALRQLQQSSSMAIG